MYNVMRISYFFFKLKFISSLISLTFPFLGDEADGSEAPEKTEKASSIFVKALKVESCYHLEFELPGYAETVNVDLIMFGLVAKIFKDDEFKVTKS